jgi:1-aminocyclopropane-1-carboxylate deaminase/D-cysteine desulfhydrase-like pyridoxal-dependent ACC family enzyme
MPITRDELLEPVHRLPREPIAQLPTPMEEATRLREAIGPEAPRIFLKREDYTGFAYGGNKVRHLEFRLADIRKRGATALTIMNPAVSNHARLHAALAAKYGLKAYILKIPSDHDADVNGNLLLSRLFGAEIIEPTSGDPETMTREYRELIARLEAEGHVVYDTHNDPYSTIAGAFGFIFGAVEMLDQLEAVGVEPDRIFLVYGASAAGLVLAGKLLGKSYRVHAVNIGDAHDPHEYVLDFANRTSELLGYGIEITSDDFDVSTEYGEPGYAVPGPDALEAISLAARTEAMIVDPVYTGKSLAALIGEIRKGHIRSDENVVFIHTGGTPNPFSYSQMLAP